MMRALLSAFILLVFIHLIAVVGFVGWLKASDRLDGARVQRVVEIFGPTVATEQAAAEEAKAAREQAEATATELGHLERAGRGPQTLEAQLAANRTQDNYDRYRLERLKADTRAIRTRLEQDKAEITRGLADLRAREAAFDERVARRTEALQNEDFRRVVASLEKLPPKQAKEVLVAYVEAGDSEQAVDYLAAMQLRKSAGVLKTFRTPEETQLAAQLIEQLRTRSTAAAAAAAANPTSADSPRTEPTL